MSKNTNDGLIRSGTGCFIAAPAWQQWASSWCEFGRTMTPSRQTRSAADWSTVTSVRRHLNVILSQRRHHRRRRTGRNSRRQPVLYTTWRRDALAICSCVCSASKRLLIAAATCRQTTQILRWVSLMSADIITRRRLCHRDRTNSLRRRPTANLVVDSCRLIRGRWKRGSGKRWSWTCKLVGMAS